jgi:arylsulfatase A-like enzyme
MDAHQPLDPPRRSRDLFATDGTPRDERRFAAWGELNQPEHMRAPELPAFRENKLAVYDGALRYMDDQLAQLFAELDRRGLREDTLVVVTSDHGEEFWDHGLEQCELYDTSARAHVGVGHGQTQFQELLAVPLILAGPGVAASEVETRVSLLDLGATLFDLALGERAYAFGEGRSFGALARGERAPARAVVSEETSCGYELKALVRPDGLKYVQTQREDEQDCLFDLAQDPLERRNLLAERPEDARRLRDELTAVVEAARARRAEPGAAAEASAAALEALGYAGEATKRPKGPRTPERVKARPKR